MNPKKQASGRSPRRRGILGYVALVLFALTILSPLVLALITAVQPTAVSLGGRPTLNFTPTLDNFEKLFGEYQLGRPLLNSLITSLTATLIGFVVGIPAAYALSRATIRGRTTLTAGLFAARGLPAIGIAIPFFLIFTFVGLIDSVLALIIVYLPFVVALVVWLMEQYIDSIPVALDEAAAIDGCSRLRTLISIIVPLSGPGLAATGVLAFMYGWNNFFYPLILTHRKAVTVTVALTQFLGDYTINWGGLMAGVVLLSLPIVAIGFVFRKYMVAGMTAGSVK